MASLRTPGKQAGITHGLVLEVQFPSSEEISMSLCPSPLFFYTLAADLVSRDHF